MIPFKAFPRPFKGSFYRPDILRPSFPCIYVLLKVIHSDAQAIINLHRERAGSLCTRSSQKTVTSAVYTAYQTRIIRTSPEARLLCVF